MNSPGLAPEWTMWVASLGQGLALGFNTNYSLYGHLIAPKGKLNNFFWEGFHVALLIKQFGVLLYLS